uniref:Uncharacterized protein n=1 Tax=Romanomermis culicivorax TaxID=13658 RepID=A0A915L3D4_ROMCU
MIEKNRQLVYVMEENLLNRVNELSIILNNRLRQKEEGLMKTTVADITMYCQQALHNPPSPCDIIWERKLVQRLSAKSVGACKAEKKSSLNEGQSMTSPKERVLRQQRRGLKTK